MNTVSNLNNYSKSNERVFESQTTSMPLTNSMGQTTNVSTTNLHDIYKVLQEQLPLPKLSEKTLDIIRVEASTILSETMKKIGTKATKKWKQKEGSQVSSNGKSNSPLSNIVEGLMQDENIQEQIKEMAKTIKAEQTTEGENEENTALSSDAIKELLNRPDVQQQMQDMVKNMTDEDNDKE